MIFPDFAELLSAFNAARVEYLVIGAHALAVHGHVRATKDLDVWVRPSPRNAARVLDALRSFGAPTARLRAEDFAKPDVVFQIGVDPVRIDVITLVSGLEFADAWPNRVRTTYAGMRVSVIGREDLIRNKLASGRLQDLADVAALGGAVPAGRAATAARSAARRRGSAAAPRRRTKAPRKKR